MFSSFFILVFCVELLPFLPFTSFVVVSVMLLFILFGVAFVGLSLFLFLLFMHCVWFGFCEAW